jgi:hypothetical protein
MAAINRLPKHGKHQEQKWTYTTSEDVKEAVRQAMSDEGLALMFSLDQYEVIRGNDKNPRAYRVVGQVTFTIGDGETGQTVSRSIWGEAVDYSDKAFFKLYTTTLKYFLLTTFLISSGDELDADAGDGEGAPVKAGEKKTSKPARSPQNGKQKAPANSYGENPQSLFEKVQNLTNNYYKNPPHLYQALGGAWPDFNDPAEVESSVSIAVDHWVSKQEAE